MNNLVVISRQNTYQKRVSDQYAAIETATDNLLRACAKFGALLTEVGYFLGAARGRGKDGEGLQAWLAENCPEVNYKTAMGYKALAAAQICGEFGEIIGREAAAEKYSAVGNAAKMREALLMVKKLFDGRIMFQNAIREAHKAVEAALAAPPRNCDRPECATTKAAQDVWRKEDGGKTAY